eukprot:CAMPEP_0173149670 /NCGR_PEP_ID=MMETSP1105-20130129/10471_1 /TAXON_ID=2985 /ORGANISM="Ochromonas sp., Strain BG-1" /LENGTH=318 /DNA_ID=CAMNT_0014064595 /DNA_START=33 /DNA_END=989 /DNA_ORIENTATION=+
MGGGPSKELRQENEKLKSTIYSLEREIEPSKALRKENEELKRQVASLERAIGEVTAQMTHLRGELCQDRVVYDGVRDFITKWQEARPQGIVFKEATAIIGPKGSGKSTYLWMKDPGFPKPQKCYGNGTNNIQIRQEHGFMDTIGINFEIMSLVRLLVLFLIHDAVPMNAIFCHNDRIERTIAILTHMNITKYYVLAMDVKYLHKYFSSYTSYFFNPNINAAFDEEAYAAWHSRNNNCRRCDAETRVPINPLLNTFEEALEFIFPLGRVNMVSYEYFMSTLPADQSQKTARDFAYMVCRELKAFYEVYAGREVAFMDQI